MTTNLLAAVFAGISAFAAVITAVIAASSLLGARNDSRVRTRPVVIAELRKATLSRGTQDLVIKNYGQSAARDVTVSFDPELPAAGEDKREPQLPPIRQRYSSPIPLMAPGQALRNVYVAGPGERRVPEELLVTVSYVAADKRIYGDTFKLRASTLGLESLSTPSGSNDRVIRQIEAIEAVARAVDKR